MGRSIGGIVQKIYQQPEKKGEPRSLGVSEIMRRPETVKEKTIVEVYLITGNKNKLREAEQILNMKLKNIELDLDEIQELDSDKISESKVKQAWENIKKPLFVWDQSLYIHCLNDFPGPLIKWFWEKVTLEKICDIANLFKDNKVYTKTTITFYDGKEIRHFYGIVNGRIPESPRGKNGFAWDPIFIPDGSDKTFAEMHVDEKNAVSMHRIALEKLRDFLNEKGEMTH